MILCVLREERYVIARDNVIYGGHYGVVIDEGDNAMDTIKCKNKHIK